MVGRGTSDRVVRSEPLAWRAGTVVLWVFNAAVAVRSQGEAAMSEADGSQKETWIGYWTECERCCVTGNVDLSRHQTHVQRACGAAH